MVLTVGAMIPYMSALTIDSYYCELMKNNRYIWAKSVKNILSYELTTYGIRCVIVYIFKIIR